MPRHLKLRPTRAPSRAPVGREIQFLDEADGHVKLVDDQGAVSDLEAPGGGGSLSVDNGVDPPAEVTTLVAPGATFAGDSATLLIPTIIGPFSVLGTDAALAADWILLSPIARGVLVERILVFCTEAFVGTGRLAVSVGDPAISLPAIWNAASNPGPALAGGNAPDFESAAPSTGGNLALAVSGAVLVGEVDTVGLYATIDSEGTAGSAVIYAIIATPAS